MESLCTSQPQLFSQPQLSTFSGASGGSLIAAALAREIPVEEVMAAMDEVSQLCRSHGTVWRLESALRSVLQKYISYHPSLIGRLRVAVTRVRPGPMQSPEMIDNFDDTDDLLDALVASSFIPLYLAPSVTTTFRGGRYCDGGLIHILPPVSGGVHSLPFKPRWFPQTLPGQKEGTLISPALTPAFPYGPFQMAKFALLPPTAEQARDLYKWGSEAAHTWLEENSANKQK